MRRNIIDMTGKRFSRLAVIRRAGDRNGTIRWECLCDCGKQFIADGTSIRAGRTKSCGCLTRYGAEDRLDKGEHKTDLYRIWMGIRQRCGNPKAKKYHLYGGKGITVCERWNDFRLFALDMGKRPPGTSIDRIDGSKGYAPDNCRWATAKDQGNNTSANRLICINGQTKTLSQWADETGLKANTLLYRVRRGWTPEEAISSDVQKRTIAKEL